MDFLDKVVIVTGAGSGIGQSVAIAYAEKGAKVVVAELNQDAGCQTAKDIESAGHEAVFVQTDVRKQEDVVRLFDLAMEKFGTVDILINNAGVSIWKSPSRIDRRRMG